MRLFHKLAQSRLHLGFKYYEFAGLDVLYKTLFSCGLNHFGVVLFDWKLKMINFEITRLFSDC